MSIRLRVSFIIGSFILLILLIVSYFNYNDKKKDIKENYDKEVFLSCQSITAPIADYVRGKLNENELKIALDNVFLGEYFKRNWLKVIFAKNEGQDMRQYLLPSSLFKNIKAGKVYIWANNEEWAKDTVKNSKPRVEIKKIYEWGKEFIPIIYYKGISQFIILTLDPKSRPFGNIYIFASDEPMRILLNKTKAKYLLFVIFSVLLSMILVYFLSYEIAKPMEKISKALLSLSQGKLDEKISISGTKEIKEMQKSYEILRDSLYEKEKIEKNLLSARQIQMGLMPKDIINFGLWEIYGFCIPASEVGGDFYFFHKTKDYLYAGVGDVSGKGMDAAILAALSLGSLKTVFRGEESIDLSFNTLNDILFEELQGKNFLCLNSIRIYLHSKILELVNAGQPYPILIKRKNEIEYWNIKNGDLPLGSVEEPNYNKDILEIKEGEGIILYSDGGPELKNTKGELLSFENFIKILGDTIDDNLKEWGNKLYLALNDWKGQAKQNDDITVLLIRYGSKKWKTTKIF